MSSSASHVGRLHSVSRIVHESRRSTAATHYNVHASKWTKIKSVRYLSCANLLLQIPNLTEICPIVEEMKDAYRQTMLATVRCIYGVFRTSIIIIIIIIIIEAVNILKYKDLII